VTGESPPTAEPPDLAPVPDPLPEPLARAVGTLPAAILRPVTDEDADGVIELIGATFAEYPGCVLDLSGIDGDLLTPRQTAAATDAAWWVLEADRRIVATIGAGPRHDDGSVELKRLYVAASHRRRGLARGLVALVEAHAEQAGATSIELWSDTRFHDAHALYTALGYARTGESRDLHDPSNTTEYRFTRQLVGG
jgi:putative acetyltransferase